MPLNIPSYPVNFSATPLTNVYAKITQQNVNSLTGDGLITLGIYLNKAASDGGLQPIDSLTVSLGQVVSGQFTFPSLAQIDASAATVGVTNSLTPVPSIRAAVYLALLSHPK